MDIIRRKEPTDKELNELEKMQDKSLVLHSLAVFIEAFRDTQKREPCYTEQQKEMFAEVCNKVIADSRKQAKAIDKITKNYW